MPQFITPERHLPEELKTKYATWFDKQVKLQVNKDWYTDIERLKLMFDWDYEVTTDNWKKFLAHSKDVEPCCSHDITVPEVFQDYGDSAHRACWTLASKCKKCGAVFVYGTGFGLFEDKEGHS